jgi:acyl-coenzyme A thioesterase PaaI-like protein
MTKTWQAGSVHREFHPRFGVEALISRSALEANGCELVLDSVDHKLCATIQLSTHFIAAVLAGDFVIGRGEIVRRTRSIVFVRGSLWAGNRQVAAIDGIWKVLHVD